ncbi:nSTAND1 domain-containing NTPase [Streptomyces sp. NPDC054834]
MAGRPESPLDPSAGPVGRFAAELRKLRAEAGSPTYRVMAQRTNQGASTLSQAAAGERLPTLPVVLAYARACGGDEADWEARWREAAAEAAAEPRTEDEDAEPPYRGLARFEPGDADLFFGREELTDRLLDLASSRRFTAVFGPSGSGKSSLLRAGLIPRLRAPDATRPRPAALRVITPGEHPLLSHGQRLRPKDADGDTWLLVDQFEELYTLCTDPGERAQFIEQLLACTDPASRLRVVIAVRADFLGRCAAHPRLTAALQDATVLAGPMSRDELREAIVKPAQAAGLIVERALTARILDGVEDEPGALPLMSHALLETWRRRKGRALTLEAYEAAGGLHGAIARTAEDAHARLTPAQADVARRILLRLITPGEGTPDTRRPAPREELAFDSPTDTAVVLDRLARARLLTLDHDTVDLAHEALITAWPRLRQWIEDARERLRLHRQLTEAARTWNDLDRDPGALYRGARLGTTEDAFTAAGPRRELTVLEEEFFNESLGARDREQRAAARTTRRLRVLVAGLTALVLVACAAATVAFQQRAAARAERTTAVSRQITAEADRLRGADIPAQTQNVALAALLDVASYRMRRNTQTYTSLVSAANSGLFTDVPEPDGTATGEMVFARNGARLAHDRARHLLAIVGADYAVRLWDTTRFNHPRRLGPTLLGTVVAMAPDGRVLAVGEAEGGVRLWDVSHPTHPVRLSTIPKPGDGDVGSLAFAPDGHRLAVSADSTDLWDVGEPRHPVRLARSLTGDVAAFSPNRKLMATADTVDGKVWLWDTSRRGRPPAVGTLHTRTDRGSVLVFSPDGRYLATNGAGAGEVRLWDVHKPDRLTYPSLTVGTSDGTDAQDVAYSPDGRMVAVAGDNGVQLWNDVTTELPERLGQALGQRSSAGIAMEFSSDGRSLITEDRVMRIWSLPPGVLLGCGTWSAAGFAPDGRTMAAACTEDGPVRLWDTSDPGDPRQLAGSLPGTAAEFSPRGHLLAVIAPDGGVRLYDVSHPARPRALGHLAAGRDDTVVLLAFTPDGHGLVTHEETSDQSSAIGADIGDGDGKLPFETFDDGVHIRTWNIGDPRHPREEGRAAVLERNAGAGPLARSPDGDLLAVVDQDRRILLWDVTDPAHPVRRGRSFVGDVVTFAPHGHTLAIGSTDDTVRLWDASDPSHVTPLGTALDAGGSVTGAAFRPDGHRLAVGTGDGMIRLYDVTHPAHPTAVGDPLVGHTEEIDTLVFTPDGQVLATGGLDGTTRLWKLDAERAIHRICAVTGRALTRGQWRRHVGEAPYRNPCPGSV